MSRISLLFHDFGYGSTFSTPVILYLLEQLGIYPSNAAIFITPADVASILAMMAKTHSGLGSNPTLKPLLAKLLDDMSLRMVDNLKTWNLELFFSLLVKLIPNLDWYLVLKKLDAPDTAFVDANSLAIVLKASKTVLKVCILLYILECVLLS